jgi:hypothetical protein
VEELVPFLIFIGWMVIQFLSRMAGKKKQQPQDMEPGSPTKSFQELLREATEKAEDLVEWTDQPPPPPPPPFPIVVKPQTSEHRPTLSEHRPTASEHRVTASEHRVTASEHRVTASEHRPGDVRTDMPPPPVTSQRRGRSRFVQGLLADLSGPDGLRRSILLREVLGPPVSLRQSSER